MSISRAYGEEDVNVLIHDAARPFLTGELIQKCIEALSGHDGVLPVLPMKDTVYYSDNGNTITSLIRREMYMQDRHLSYSDLSHTFRLMKALCRMIL